MFCGRSLSFNMTDLACHSESKGEESWFVAITVMLVVYIHNQIYAKMKIHFVIDKGDLYKDTFVDF